MIKLTNQEIYEIQNFVEKSEVNFYSTRNQFDVNKKKNDIKIGKCGEYIVYKYFNKKYPTITKPDFNIYEKYDKSWDYDLKTDKYNIHVKSQDYSSSKLFGISWIFEKSDKHIFQNYGDNDWVCFVLVNINNYTGKILKLVKIKTLHEKNLFKSPKLNKLKTKLAVYFSDLKLI